MMWGAALREQIWNGGTMQNRSMVHCAGGMVTSELEEAQSSCIRRECLWSLAWRRLRTLTIRLLLLPLILLPFQAQRWAQGSTFGLYRRLGSSRSLLRPTTPEPCSGGPWLRLVGLLLLIFCGRAPLSSHRPGVLELCWMMRKGRRREE